MRATIDKAGRIVVPKRLRDDLGFTPGLELELELEAVDGRLEVSVPAAETRIEYVGGRPVIRYPGDPPPFGTKRSDRCSSRSGCAVDAGHERRGGGRRRVAPSSRRGLHGR